ncbi:M50 family metallopeptidase [Streptomyces omiyaensis]|uniref:M50 family metallopeptidase n=1 Tax=Streptomyces omiyaensis TaxID=68247 RepID=UPI0016776B7B|nr:M50 family metallopeptidase [Streptomyces omiyaensis]
MRAHRPALRPGVRCGPALLRGPRTVHLVRHPVTGAAFEVGEKEYFLIARLDGTRNLDDLAPAYAERFGRRLGVEHWTRLLGLLGARGLLAGSPDPVPAAAPAPPPNSLRRGTRPLVRDADATTARLHRLLRPLLRPAVQLPLCAAVLALLGLLAAQAGPLVGAAGELTGQPGALAGIALFLWLSITVHELAHGVAAQHYGGHVAEIGVKWRLPAALLYCAVDDYLFLPGLRAKLVVAGAGAHLNLVLLLPFGAWWVLLPEGAPERPFVAGLLILGTLQGLGNLVPLPPLDGYRMLGHALGTARLAPETLAYLALRRGGGAAAAAYPPRARRIYAGYAAGAVLLVLCAATGTAALLFLLLR